MASLEECSLDAPTRGITTAIIASLLALAATVIVTSADAGPRAARAAECRGEEATIVGKNRDEEIKSTRRKDVILARGATT